MPFLNYDRLFESITELVMHHSPSGMETEVDRLILQKFADLGIEAWLDEAGNAIAKIPGVDSSYSLAITAHKDEIGAIVKDITNNGRVKAQKLGGTFPWVYGEGVVDLLGDRATISGILSFGSRHVSHLSPQKVHQEEQALRWENVWIETKCTLQQLDEAGIRPGTRIVVGKHRKQPVRLQDYIGSYTLDNKASVAILLALAEKVKNPPVDIYLVASAKEEVGAIGALYFTQRQKIDALIALEICPLSSEYPIDDGEEPVLLSQDSYGMYDESLNFKIRETARSANIPLQLAILNSFGSDASIAMKFGHVARAACLAFPTQNTHGYEIAHLGAIANCCHLLSLFCQTQI
jgi:putative aminopeptidase FrvX